MKVDDSMAQHKKSLRNSCVALGETYDVTKTTNHIIK